MNEDYSKLMRTCNSLIHKISKNIWCKNLPAAEQEKLNMQFDIPPGDCMPRKMVMCLSRQIHNLKCVGKILEKLRAAQEFVDELEEISELSYFDLKEEVFKSARKHIGLLSKCELAMKKRFSLRNRVVDVNPNKILCRAITDINLPEGTATLSASQDYYLVDNMNPQLWIIQTSNGEVFNVPPLFLAVDSSNAEAKSIRSTRISLIEVIRKIQIAVQHQLIEVNQVLNNDKEILKSVLESAKSNSTTLLLSCLSSLCRICTAALENERRFAESEIFLQQELIIKLLNELPISLLEKLNKFDTIFVRLTKLCKFLQVYSNCLSFEMSLQRLNSGSNRPGFRAKSRTHSLCNLHRRTSVFEFEFDFEEKTHKLSSFQVEPSDVSNSESDSVFSDTRTETVTRSKHEVKRRFFISSVWDGSRDVPLKTALETGLIIYERGVYVDPEFGEEIPIEAAMSVNKIKVEFTSSKKVSEDLSTFGIITIRDVKQPEAPFTIKSVLHPVTKRWLTLESAVSEGVINTEHSLYRNPQTSEEMQLVTAVDENLVLIESDETDIANSPNVKVTSYVVHGVIDRKARRKVTFQEACQLGLVNKETGAFIDNQTGDKVYPLEAIRRGFFKAYPVEDPSLLDIDPENRITVSHINKLRNKLTAFVAFAKFARNGLPSNNDGDC